MEWLFNIVNENVLAEKSPRLISEWHPTKNGPLRPIDVTNKSGKKVWWKCPRGSDHEWQAVIANRTKGIGCPICSNQKVARSNSLGTVNPKLASEWHTTKNFGLTPFDVLPSTKRRVWWQCSKNPEHEWESSLNNRTNAKGCPFCCNQKLIRSNSLGSVNKMLAKEWHPTKNGKLSPFEVAPSAKRRVWWQCARVKEHEWQATINHRDGGTECPKCNTATSIQELRIFSELKSIFPLVEHRVILKRHEVDVYIPDLKVGIEFDGFYWHHEKQVKDQEKYKALESTLLLIRVREEALQLIHKNDIGTPIRKFSVSIIKEILMLILKNRTVSTEVQAKVQQYLKTEDWVASEYFHKLYSERNHLEYEKSLSCLHPKIAKEWHPTKNHTLLPEHFSFGSGKKVWWLGNCKHEWLDSINHRTRGRDCPKCRYKKASLTQKRKRKNPDQLNLF